MANVESWLREGLASAVDDVIRKFTDDEIKKATEKVEAAVRRAVAEAVLNVATSYDLQRDGQDLMIRVRMEKK